MTAEEVSSPYAIYGNLYMTNSSQKGEASIYHIWKRKSTIYGNCNHALAQLFSQVLVNNFSYCRKISPPGDQMLTTVS